MKNFKVCIQPGYKQAHNDHEALETETELLGGGGGGETCCLHKNNICMHYSDLNSKDTLFSSYFLGTNLNLIFFSSGSSSSVASATGNMLS